MFLYFYELCKTEPWRKSLYLTDSKYFIFLIIYWKFRVALNDIPFYFSTRLFFFATEGKTSNANLLKTEGMSHLSRELNERKAGRKSFIQMLGWVFFFKRYDNKQINSVIKVLFPSSCCIHPSCFS